MKTVLVLGGYGNFGKRISQALSNIQEINLLISGRDIVKAKQLVESLKGNSLANLKAVAIDIRDEKLESIVKELVVDIVIHTCGPFQGQDYSVPKACINAGCHYIDLADDRDFVSNINSLNKFSEEQGLLVVSGASSVPGLSSTVIDYYQDQFASIDSIDMAIAPGNKAERGEATVRGILSYTGHPFKAFVDGEWTNIYGWMDAKKINFSGILGRRWIANVDVPDLKLFPERYKVNKRVTFQAGLELSLLHLSMVCMAFFSKIGFVKSWSPLTKLIVKISHLFNRFGTDKGGMQILIQGQDQGGNEKSIKWTLYADNGIGPYIPTISAILIAKKLLDGSISKVGSMPCLGLYQLNEFDEYTKQLDIYSKVEIRQADTVG